MTSLWEAIGASFQPAVIAIATAALLGLLRLVTPTVRWSRRLKQDSEVYGALPAGREKELWEARVVAQAERLRLYREQHTWGQQAIAWYAFVAIVVALPIFISEAFQGWPAFRSYTTEELLLSIPLFLLALLNFAFVVGIAVRLVLGLSLAPRSDGAGHYPKYVALIAAQIRRRDKRIAVEERINRIAYHRDKERRALKKTARKRA